MSNKPSTRRIWVRPPLASEGPTFGKWIEETPLNLWDPEVMAYPSTRTFVAHAEGTPIVFLPVQSAVMLESLAFNPEAEKGHVAVALKALLSNISLLATLAGQGEIYFACKEPTTQEFAERNGFERLPWPMFRLKISSLERPHAHGDAV